MSEGQYKISIIIPARNDQETLMDCIFSAIKQTYRNIEIILVDDGSKDKSGKIMDIFASKTIRIRAIHHSKSAGKVTAWKTGINAATGDYIMFIDPKDTIDLNMLDRLSKHLTGSDREVVIGNYEALFEDGYTEFMWQSAPPGEYTGKKASKILAPNILGNESVYVHMDFWGKIFSKELITDNVKYLKEGLGDKFYLPLILSAMYDAKRFFVTDRKTYYKRTMPKFTPASMAADKKLNEFDTIYDALKSMIDSKFSKIELEFRINQLDQEYIMEILRYFIYELGEEPIFYKDNILYVAGDERVKSILKVAKMRLENKDNKRAYFLLKHANKFFIWVVRNVAFGHSSRS